MRSNGLLRALRHLLLAFSAAGLLAWLTMTHVNMLVYLCLPLSAVLLEFSLVLQMVEKESAHLDGYTQWGKVAMSKESSQRTR